MPNKNPTKKAFVLDPRALLLQDFEAKVIDRLRSSYFNRASETKSHPKYLDEYKEEDARALDHQRLDKVITTNLILDVLLEQSRTEDGQLDWAKLTRAIRKKLPLFDGSVIQDCVREVFISSKTPLLDLDSLRQLEEKGKIVFILGNESGPVEELVNERIKEKLLKAHANGKVKIEEIGVRNLFLRDAVHDNDVLFIKTGEHGNANRPEKVLKVTEVLSGLKSDISDISVVDTELGVLQRVKEGSGNKKLKGGVNSLFKIGPGTSQTMPYGIKMANSLKELLLMPRQPEGQAPLREVSSGAKV